MSVPKTPHKDRYGRIYSTQHWVAMGQGVILDGGVKFGMMDPALRYEYFHQSSYKPQEVRVFCSYQHYMLTKNYWWLNIFDYLQLPPMSSNEIAEDEVVDSKATPDVSLQWAGLSITSSTAVKIEKIEASGSGLTLLANSIDASESSSLFDQVSNDEHDDEDEVYEGDMNEIPEPEPDYSEAMLSQVPAGTVKVFLYGQHNTSWRLDICAFDASGTPEDKLLTGVLDDNGRAIAEISYDPGVIALKLGILRSLPQEKKVFTDFLEVIDSNPDGREFFLEDRNRACGIRVVVSDLNITIPEIHKRVRLQGKILQASPEIVVEANSVEDGGLAETVYQIKPMAFSGKWPEMANCLLGKICGKVIAVNSSIATLDSGNEFLVAGLDSPAVGDFVSFCAVLRADRNLKAITGTTVKY